MNFQNKFNKENIIDISVKKAIKDKLQLHCD